MEQPPPIPEDSTDSTTSQVIPPVEIQERKIIDDLIASVECPLCLSMIVEPISTACGHSFCRLCLVKSLRRHKKKCPSCRAICHLEAETAEENIMIKAVCMTLNPASYLARQAEQAAEKASWSTVLPIFYYNDVLFPGGKLGLHLFENRYKIMMQRVMSSTRRFAYVPNFSNYKANIGDVALVANLLEVEPLPDGRFVLDAAMEKSRYIITDHFVEEGTGGLHFCKLEPFTDDPVPPEAEARVAQLFDAATKLAGIITTQIAESGGGGGVPPAPSDAEGLSLWLLSVGPCPTSLKYQLLKSKDRAARLEVAVQSFMGGGGAGWGACAPS